MAQLGARFHGMEEVIGSIPIRSTKPLLISDIRIGSTAFSVTAHAVHGNSSR